jgi:hypothetical protein
MLSVLAHLVFDPKQNLPAMEATAGTLMLKAQVHGGAVISFEANQLKLFVQDIRWAIPAFQQALYAAQSENFGLKGSFVQPVQATPDPKAESDFTERTHETLYRLLGSTEALEFTISPKMLSLIQLSAPEHCELFKKPAARSAAVLVMRATATA